MSAVPHCTSERPIDGSLFSCLRARWMTRALWQFPHRQTEPELKLFFPVPLKRGSFFYEHRLVTLSQTSCAFFLSRRHKRIALKRPLFLCSTFPPTPSPPAACWGGEAAGPPRPCSAGGRRPWGSPALATVERLLTCVGQDVCSE